MRENLSARIRMQADSLIPAGIGLAVFLFHMFRLPYVASVFEQDNLGFDFDIGRFTSLWTASPFPISQNDGTYWTRHPLAVLVRVIARPMVDAGLDPHLATRSIAAFCAALSAALVFKIARALDVTALTATLFALFWSVSTTPLLLGVLPEAYGLALAGLALQFLLMIRWMKGEPVSYAARVAAAVINFGITVTNAALAGLGEFLGRVQQQELRKAALATLRFGAIAGSLALASSALSFWIWPVQDLHSPLGALKRIYWSASAPTGAVGVMADKQGFANVAWTFAETSFVAPTAARYPSGDPSGPYLWDLRGQKYSVLGWISVIGWSGLLLYGASIASRDSKHWPIWVTSSTWLLVNILLHSYWQYRGSVFLYAANSSAAFLVIALAGAVRPSRPIVYQGLLSCLVVVTALNNLVVYSALPKLQ